MGELGKCWPEAAKVLINHYVTQANQNQRCTLSFAVQSLPKSLNHQYIKGRSFPNSEGKSRTTFRLHPETLVFRQLTQYAIGSKKLDWKPVGVTAAIILFESPLWLTQKLTVREMDADNLVKPLFDAIQQHTEIPDELNWQVHFFKVQSKKTRTIVYLFDLGDVVEYFTEG